MQKKLIKIFILVDLLLQEIEEPTAQPTKETKKIQDKCRELEKMLEPVLDRFYESNGVRKSNFFIDMQNKIEYIFNKELKKIK